VKGQIGEGKERLGIILWKENKLHKKINHLEFMHIKWEKEVGLSSLKDFFFQIFLLALDGRGVGI